MAVTIEEKWHDLLYGVRRSVRYHMRRRRFIEQWNSVIIISSVIFGVVAVAALIQNDALDLRLTTIIAEIGAIVLAISTFRLARQHADLCKRFILLEKELTSLQVDESEYAGLNHIRLDIEMDEPPVLHVLNKLCDNDMVRAMGYPEDQMLDIKWHQRIVAHYFDVNPQSIKRRCQA